MAMSFLSSNIINHLCHPTTAKLPETSVQRSRFTNEKLVLGYAWNMSRRGVRAVYNERKFSRKREGDFDKKENPSSGLHGGGQEEKPYRILPNGRKVYLDELDILTLLEPPKYLVPLDKGAFNHAAYLWKKIGDIPEERRHRLFYMLQPKHISRIWEFSGKRYNDVSSPTNNASTMLPPAENESLSPEFWSGRINGGFGDSKFLMLSDMHGVLMISFIKVPWPIGWMSRFKQAFFLGKDGKVYGRVIPGGLFMRNIANYLSPLYFLIRNVSEVMATEEPCDLACEFGEGQAQLLDLPMNFPKPANHPWPFNDQLVIYIRPAGPSVLIGQVWQEGRELEQVPQKFLGELLLIKDYPITK